MPTKQGVNTSDDDFEAQLSAAVIFNVEGDNVPIEQTLQDEVDEDRKLTEMSKSVEANSFNRLYYDGLQQKLSR